MSTTLERFDAWLRSMPLPLTELASRLGGYSASHLSHIRKGRRLPGRDLALKIERLSGLWEGGAIKVSEWNSLPDAHRD